MSVKSMLLTTSTWGDKIESFKLIPISKECPYSEAFLDPVSRVLVVLGNQPREQFTFLNKVDKFGEAMKDRGANLKERVRVQGVKEYYISRPDEIIEFVNMFAFNADTYSFQKYLQGEIILTEEAAKEAEANTATANLS